MSLTRLLRGLKIRHIRPKQNPSCHILNLPKEILILILDYLPQYQQIIFSQTCYPLRCILLNYNKAHKGSDNLHLSANLNQHQRLEYLFALARSRPKVWACHRCSKLHHRRKLGIPMSQESPCDLHCQKKSDYYTQGVYKAYYGHIQFALKYSRLQIENGNSVSQLKKSDKWYLDNIMKPFSAPIRPHEGGMSDKIKGRLHVFPKIIDGRFLIHSVWTFAKDIGNVSRQSIGQFRICQHQTWDPSGYSNSTLLNIQAYAFRLGREVHHSCDFCETDFSIQASSEVTVVRIWQNLGSEVTYLKNHSWHWQADFCRRNYTSRTQFQGTL
ncbi:hypothetical protein J3E69DRAFT_376040 [Trichoderma sp. SZMC 28015]